jgi:hypothetical protein
VGQKKWWSSPQHAARIGPASGSGRA